MSQLTDKIEQLRADASSLAVDRQALQRWFTGKSLANLQAVIFPILDRAEADGFWSGADGRKVMAGLNRANLAQRLARRIDATHIRGTRWDAARPWHDLAWMAHGPAYLARMQPGLVYLLKRAPRMDPADQAMVAEAQQYVLAFEPLMRDIAAWNTTPPIPRVTYERLSPTVERTLENSRLALVVSTLRYPKVEWRIERRMVYRKERQRQPDGRMAMVRVGEEKDVRVGYLVWPAGTKHNGSRFAFGNGANQQCHACGHAIQNPFNWVPLLMDDAAGVPHSLWVGSDCAKTIFGVSVKDRAEFAAGAGSPGRPE